MKIAICHWGLPRRVKETSQNHNELIYNELKKIGIDYDIWFHTWKLKENKQRIWGKECKTPINYEDYKVLKPDYYFIDDQEEFMKTVKDNWDKYYYPNCKNEWIPSLLENHLCALESQKRCFTHLKSSGIKYDDIFFIRPDSFFEKPLDIPSILDKLKQENTCIISQHKSYEGYNDRLAFLNYNYADKYACRIDEIIQFRKDYGRIVSEKFMKWICDKYFNIVKMDIQTKELRPI